MQFPARFSNLPEYAFPRLRSLLDPHPAGGPVLHMSIGEPKHPFPDWVGQVLAETVADFARYPANDGTPELLDAISGWLRRRYGVEVGHDRLMPLNGTREGLYNVAMALVPEDKAGARPVVLIPNPFYQVYAVAAASVGGEPVFVAATEETGFLPDYAALPPETLDRVAAAYVCSPANPQGGVASRDYWRGLLDLAERHDFRILADECYSEIWRDAPPPGILEVAAAHGADPERVVAFHSLSKRSNVPGLRSGFVAAGPQAMTRIRQLRAYAGAPLPGPLQAVAARLWADEAHVDENRALYQRKYRLADDIFADVPGAQAPQAGFFLWLPVPDGETAALELWTKTGVRVLPGAYLARGEGPANPGAGYVRVAMVAPEDEMARGLTAIRATLYGTR
ncbi:aminotransferase class I/II-fold pyridoxal phosphate-dependent enzyme [Mesobaculum littorinae]|uniref:Aminotransferase class I/II-fold pyridoxal phosphate-dependent enzyme n=1 Tax=Mesobaculum littorinae TaxID=2486419 RepID=A0A438ADC0_9RHOB|nr:aminotransferase class I/II-fold pyridoxal phosphate-dependent enzyme [Mesobaculum littorinae]RVV96679.1 aminotransferase class I/II-fold pyridoxal phosphate-dependent enzyme [Mesobaculum littorinae]